MHSSGMNRETKQSLKVIEAEPSLRRTRFAGTSVHRAPALALLSALLLFAFPVPFQVNIYGTAWGGGTGSSGVVFEVTR